MRIISGKYKGKRIIAPKSIKARPTTDFAKESLFNILDHQIDFDGLEVLDLFGGTGNIAYEFASRGALSVTSVDISIDSYKFINSFAFENQLPVKGVKYDVFKYLRKSIRQYPLIFADPPYSNKKIKEIPGLIFEYDWLMDDGILIVEHGRETDYSAEPNYIETRTYSKVHFSFFKK